jgi:PAS domain S-box-containing protein
MIIEGRHQKKDGTIFPIEANAFYSEQDQKGYVIAFIRDITERKRMIQALEDQSQFTRQIIDTVPNLIFVKNQSGEFVMVNEAVAKLYQTSVSEIELKHNAAIHQNEAENLLFAASDQTVIDTMCPLSLEETFTSPDGSIKTLFTTKVPLERVDGTIDILGVSIDITEQKKNENTIRQALSEKTTLLGEIHHRVKNNLTVIFGLLEMQIIQSNNNEVAQILRESQGRIRSMSMIHEMLYKTTNLESVDVTQYIKELAQNIYKTYHRFEKVELYISNETPVFLPLNKMIPCGLLLNEILTNSYKYAFEGREKGIISISTEIENEWLVLKIADDGIGVQEKELDKKTHSLGMKLIHSFNKQLKSEMTVANNNGLQYTFKIPIHHG